MSETIGAAINEAYAELSAKADVGDNKPASEPREREPKESRDSTPQADDDDSGWEPPAWAKQWKKGSRKALRKLAALEGSNEVLPDVYKELDGTYGYITKRDQEFASHRKRWDPYDPVITALEKRFSMQGVAPQTGLQQLISVSESLERDPDNTIPWLLQQFKPRDVNALLQNLAKTHGVDLGQLGATQPYIDPAVQSMVQPLQQQVAHLTNLLQGTQQQRHQEAAKNVAQAIQAFRSETDADGNLRYPHYERLDPYMAQLVHFGGPEPLEKLYEKAMWADPELREQLIEARARKVEEKAIEDAARRTSAAEQAAGASRNVAGTKTGARENSPSNLRQIIEQEARRLEKRA